MFVSDGLVIPTDRTVLDGSVWAFAARVYGVWAVNTCRVVYVERTDRLAAFAHGTLPVHGVRGEERFEVRHHDDDRVTFTIAQASWPPSVWVQLGLPLVRAYQREFIVRAGRVFRRGVREG